MANTFNTGASTDKNSVENSETAEIQLTLMDLKSYRLGKTALNARYCTFDEFVSFAQSLVQIADTGNLRTVFNRRDFLNWCLQEGILRVEGDSLLSVEEPGTPDEPVHEGE